jgi:hypothetical protein
MAGVFDWLDTLTSTAGDLAGKAVTAAASVANTSTTAAAQTDQTYIASTSPIQTAIPGGSYLPWMLGGLVLVGLVWFVSRK